MRRILTQECSKVPPYPLVHMTLVRWTRGDEEFGKSVNCESGDTDAIRLQGNPFFKDAHFNKAVASSETQGQLVGSTRYFRAKVYIKSGRAPGHLLSSNQFQKRLSSFPLIGQKNIFLANQRGGPAGLLCRLLSCLTRTTGRFSWRVSEKRFNEAEKSQAVTWAQGNNTRRSIFTAEGIS